MINKITDKMREAQERRADVLREVDEAEPFCFQTFPSISDVLIRHEYREELYWSDEIIPMLSTPVFLEKKTDAQCFVPASMVINQRRGGDSVNYYSMLVLDIDNDKVKKPEDQLHPLGFFTKFQDKYEFCIYTTWSNISRKVDPATKKVNADWKPKFRVVFPLKEPVSIEYFKKIRPVLKDMFPYADEASFNAGHSFFLPSLHKDNAHNFEFYRNRGSMMDLKDFYGLLLARKTETLSQKAAVKAAPVYNGGYGNTIERAKATLARTDPDLPHYQWLRIGFAMRGIFFKQDLDEEAFRAFFDWSATGEKFNDKNGIMRTNWNKYREESEYDFGYIVNRSKQFPITDA